MTDAPAIYAPRPVRYRLNLPARTLWAAIALACAAVLVVGAILQPNPSGTGTHAALGLQPCQFLRRTGMPCPSCGMTTSVSLLVHGHPLASLWVQPMGTIIGLASAMTFWIALYIALTGKPAHRLAQVVPIGYYVLPLMFLAIAAWGWKIFIHWQGIDGWDYPG